MGTPEEQGRKLLCLCGKQLGTFTREGLAIKCRGCPERDQHAAGGREVRAAAPGGSDSPQDRPSGCGKEQTPGCTKEWTLTDEHERG
jgi:hypothetical protein